MRLNVRSAFVFILFIQYFSFAQSLQDGKLILKDSTLVPIKIFRNYKPEKGMSVNKFDLIKVVLNDSVKVLLPEDFKGFIIGKKIYKTLKIRTAEYTTYLFCEALEEGQASLYYYGGNAFGQKEIYIFNKPGEPQYYISLEEKIKTGAEESYSTTNPMPPDLILNAQINKMVHNVSGAGAFKAQFMRYFSDCKEVTNKLKQDWYTPSAITSLFQDYNHACGRK